MKVLVRALLCTLLAALLCQPAAAAGWERYQHSISEARWTYRNYIDLFRPGLNSGEVLMVESMTTEIVRLDGLYQKPQTYRKQTEVSYLTRVAGESVTAKGKNTLESHVQLEIPRGVTLTVAKGATVTLQGEILVLGTLVNNGTILVEPRSQPGGDGSVGVGVNGIKNHGSIENNGAMVLYDGMVENAAGGVLTNGGTLTVDSQDNWTGVYNRTGDEDRDGGRLINEGTVRLVGRAAGLASERGGAVNNNGTIAATSRDAVSGAFTGHELLRLEE